MPLLAYLASPVRSLSLNVRGSTLIPLEPVVLYPAPAARPFFHAPWNVICVPQNTKHVLLAYVVKLLLLCHMYLNPFLVILLKLFFRHKKYLNVQFVLINLPWKMHFSHHAAISSVANVFYEHHPVRNADNPCHKPIQLKILFLFTMFVRLALLTLFA